MLLIQLYAGIILNKQHQWYCLLSLILAYNWISSILDAACRGGTPGESPGDRGLSVDAGGWILIGGGSVPLSEVRSTAVCIIRAQQTQHNKYIIVYKIVLNDKMTKGESLIISPELLKGTVSDIHTMLYLSKFSSSLIFPQLQISDFRQSCYR